MPDLFFGYGVNIRDAVFEYANLVVIIPLIIAFKKNRMNTGALKTILYFLALSALTQVISYVFWKSKKNNLPLLHIYTLLEYLVLLRFYYFLLNDFIKKKIFTWLAFLFALFCLCDALLLDGIFAFNIYSRSIEALIIISLAIGWFVKVVSLDDAEKPVFSGINYINSGFLVYFSGSILLFSYSSYIREMAINSQMNLWTIHTFLAVQLYILIAIGLWKTKAR